MTVSRILRHLPRLALALLVACAAAVSPAYAATDISSTPSEHYAWNDVIGWINFYSSNTVDVGNTRIAGYADSDAGELSLDCATSPAGDICGTSNYYVTNNAIGTLAGYAWNDRYGWFSFSCENHSGCGTSNYGVSINPSTGVFSGYAWNDLIGWVSFNCADIAICGTSDYKVVTSWTSVPPTGTIDATPYDTGVAGAQINGVTWTGTKPAGTEVRIQIATSENAGGPWSFVGSDGTGSTYYTPESGVGAPLYPWAHPAGRYFAYRVTLVTANFEDTPRVDSVVVRWSP